MKKIILFIVLIAASVGVFGQNVFKYEVQANGGIRVGGATHVKIDTIESRDGIYYEVYMNGDTGTSYVPHAQREEYELIELDSALIDIYTPLSTSNIVAVTGITVGVLSEIMYYNGDSAIDISANPQIVNGTPGQMITIIGSSDVNTLKLDDGTGLQLNGAASCTLGIGDTITLIYIAGTINDWIELSRTNN